MGSLRDRLTTRKVARALMSPWRIALGVAAAVAVAVAGGGALLAVVVGAGVYGGLVAIAGARAAAPAPQARIDPFTLSEPWRRYVSAAQSATRRFDATVRAAREGPLRERLVELAGQLDHGLDECWRIARRGDEIDESLARLKVTETRARLATLRARAAPEQAAGEDAELAATIESLQAQVDAAERLRQISTDTASQLRLTQTRLDQLVTTAAEVAAATLDPAELDTGVAEVVTELEALRLAVEETGPARPATG